MTDSLYSSFNNSPGTGGFQDPRKKRKKLLIIGSVCLVLLVGIGAGIYFVSGFNSNQSDSAIDQTQTTPPGALDIAISEADALRNAGKHEEALTQYEAALKLVPQNDTNDTAMKIQYEIDALKITIEQLNAVPSSAGGPESRYRLKDDGSNELIGS